MKRTKCRQIYEEQASGKNTVRPQLEACLKSLREGDTLVVWRLDRLGRSLADLVRINRELEESYQRLRRFLPHLLETVQFGATPAGEAVLEAIKYLCRVEEHGRTTAGDPPMSIINSRRQSRNWAESIRPFIL